MFRFLSCCVIAVGLLAPVATAVADEHPRHEWRDTENEHWHQYLKERHRKDKEWTRATKREQTAYWRWRDAHPDR